MTVEHFYPWYLAYIALVVFPAGVFVHRRVPSAKQDAFCATVWDSSCKLSYYVATLLTATAAIVSLVAHGLADFTVTNMIMLFGFGVASCCATVILGLFATVLFGLPYAALAVLFKRSKDGDTKTA